jgi:uridine kinase
MKRIKPIVVGIAGPSCAGKSTIVEELKRRLPRIRSISLDEFWKDSETFPTITVNGTLSFRNWELPQNLDFDRLYDTLKRARKGARKASRGELPQIILVEGFLLLYSKRIRELLDLKIYMEVDDETIFERRMERKRFVFEGMELYYREVAIKEYRRFGRPTMKYADIILDATKPVGATVQAVLRELRLKVAQVTARPKLTLAQLLSLRPQASA